MFTVGVFCKRFINLTVLVTDDMIQSRGEIDLCTNYGEII